ncbi:hypothetical protein MJO29_003017 [Puccinia striiformis f. sp. tritici]|nr:hypothetical protein MJO29_003017 [Puccinia striiformis f. sp. tritici]
MQGINPSWKANRPPCLPEPLHKSVKRDDLNASAFLHDNLKYYHLLSFSINKAFLPAATSKAEEAVKYLKAYGNTNL